MSSCTVFLRNKWKLLQRPICLLTLLAYLGDVYSPFLLILSLHLKLTNLNVLYNVGKRIRFIPDTCAY